MEQGGGAGNLGPGTGVALPAPRVTLRHPDGLHCPLGHLPASGGAPGSREPLLSQTRRKLEEETQIVGTAANT